MDAEPTCVQQSGKMPDLLERRPGHRIDLKTRYWSGKRPANPSSYPWKYSSEVSGYFQQ